MEPDLSLLQRKRSNLVPILLVVTLCVLGIAALVVSPPRKPRKLPPAPPAQPAAARAPLLVTLVPPPADSPQGWCCVDKKLTPLSKAACDAGRGAFFAVEKEAGQRCPTAATARSGSPRGRGTGI
jgi:hypothetical protein